MGNLKKIIVFGWTEHLQQLCNWNLPFVGICQVPKRFAKRKISPSPSVWHFDLVFFKNSGPNYFCPGSFFCLARFARYFSSARKFPSSPVHEVASHRCFCESRPPGPPVHEVAVRQSSVARASSSRSRRSQSSRRVGKKSSRGEEESSRKLPQRVGRSLTTRSPGNSEYKKCQAIVPIQKCQVWSIKCQICQNA